MGLYCAEHKQPGMMNVKNKKCISPGCPKRPHFNQPGETGGLYCAEHKHPGMTDVTNKKCITSGCPKVPVFNRQEKLWAYIVLNINSQE